MSGTPRIATTEADRDARSLSDLLDASAGLVYADPIAGPERVIIPVATVESRVRGSAGPQATGRAVAVIEAGRDGVRVRPVVDARRLACTALLAAAAAWRLSRR